jgi:7-cyano-7-deazaguanine reductase
MPDDLPLGRETDYPETYDPGLLRSIPRGDARRDAGIHEPPPFDGADIWNAYELSWLDAGGKPTAYVGELSFPATSGHIVESKSLKLYLNSLNQERYGSAQDVAEMIRRDLAAVAEADVSVKLTAVADTASWRLHGLPGACIDDLDLETSATVGQLQPGLLADSIDRANQTEETLHSHLLRTNCPITNQPDWASVLIRYRGAMINHQKLLGYLISYRHHQDFHEACVERMFIDIYRHCSPDKLTVQARYSRRGGLDINPFRSNFETGIENLRLWRQ